MSHFKRIHAIRIPLDVVVTQDTDLGIYTADGSSEVRWSEYPMVGTDDLWTSGIISANGLGIEKQSADTRPGGTTASYDGYDIIIQDTKQNYLAFKELGINLLGRKIERYEFVGSEADSDDEEIKLLSTLIIQDSKWNESRWTISVRNAKYTQNAPMGTIINNNPDSGNYPLATDDINGKIVPITFGKFQVINGSPHPAKFLRTAGKQTLLSNSNLKSGGKYFTPIDQSIFPVVANFVGITTIGSNTLSLVGCADKLATNDHVLIHSGFPDGTDKKVLNIIGEYVTVDGAAATSSTLTYIDFLHKENDSMSPTPCYVLQLGLDVTGTLPGTWPVNDMQNFMESLLNKWVQVIEGGASDGTSLVGKYKKISEFQLFDLSYDVMVVTVAVESFFEKNLSGTSGAGGTNQAWVSICDIPFRFDVDTWPMAGPLDDSGTILNVATAKALWLYAYKSDTSFLERKSYSTDDDGKLIITSSMSPIGFKKLAPYGYTAVPASALNYLIINTMMFDGDPSQLLSFDIFPLLAPEKFKDATLNTWGLAGYTRHINDGLDNHYVNDIRSGFGFTEEDIVPANATRDKDDATFHRFIYSWVGGYVESGYTTVLAFETGIDFSKITQKYDNYYLGLQIETHSGNAGDGFAHSPLLFKCRKFMGAPENILSASLGAKYCDEGNIGGLICTLPDFYYLGRSIPDKNQNFNFIPPEAGAMRKISGRVSFPFPSIATIGNINSVYKIGLLFQANWPSGGVTLPAIQFKIIFYELALICQMSASISSELYALCAGRIFNDTWGARKDADDPIITPAEVIEHCERLGNWGTNTVEPGKEYDPAALIKLAGEGSFDSISLMPSTITWTKGNYTPTFQIEEAGEAWTKEVVKNVCKTYGLCTYYDNDGMACIKNLEKESPSETIAFADLVGDISDMLPPEIQDVYCQPILNYNYNSGSKKYDCQLIVTNVQAASWVSSYTIGFDNTTLHDGKSDGQTVWESCHAVYVKYRQIEMPPSSWSNCKMVTTYEEAIEILKMKIDWMMKYRISLSVIYEKGRDYHIFKHVNIVLPHHTNGNIIECIIESITKDKKIKPQGKVSLDLVLLDDPSMTGTQPQPAPPTNPQNLTFPAFTNISNVKTVIFSDDSKSVVVWGEGQEATGTLVYGTDYTIQDHNKIVLNEVEYTSEIGANSLGLLNVDVYQGN
jgi:hypothetical protein